MAKYRLSQKAKEDISDIWEYTLEQWSLTQAIKYDEILRMRIEEISENPLIGKSYDHVRKGYYKLQVEHHIIFYRPAIDTVDIIRILHDRMDIDRHL